MAGTVGLTCFSLGAIQRKQFPPFSSSSVKYKRVNKRDFSTPGNEATVFGKTFRLDGVQGSKLCVYVPVTVILLLENSSAKEASLSGKGWGQGYQDGDGNEDRQGPRTSGCGGEQRCGRAAVKHQAS